MKDIRPPGRSAESQDAHQDSGFRVCAWRPVSLPAKGARHAAGGAAGPPPQWGGTRASPEPTPALHCSTSLWGQLCVRSEANTSKSMLLPSLQRDQQTESLRSQRGGQCISFRKKKIWYFLQCHLTPDESLRSQNIEISYLIIPPVMAKTKINWWDT